MDPDNITEVLTEREDTEREQALLEESQRRQYSEINRSKIPEDRQTDSSEFTRNLEATLAEQGYPRVEMDKEEEEATLGEQARIREEIGKSIVNARIIRGGIQPSNIRDDSRTSYTQVNPLHGCEHEQREYAEMREQIWPFCKLCQGGLCRVSIDKGG